MAENKTLPGKPECGTAPPEGTACGTAAPGCQPAANVPGPTGDPASPEGCAAAKGACPTYAGLVCAWGVHLLTASGAVFGLLALTAAARGDYLASFRWMAVTLLIDAVDGGLARRFRVKAVVPSVDGALLDNVVDYFTYSVVPAFFLCMSPLAGEWGRFPAAAAVLIASGYQFSRSDAKTADHAFSGYPSYWNITVFYLFVLDFPAWFNVSVLLLCAVASFLPLRCLYPSRTPKWRAFNVVFGLFWALCLGVALFRYPLGHMPWVHLSWAYIAYYAAFSAWLTLRAGNESGEKAPS